MVTKLPTLKLFSWDYQWIYWPVYRSLELLKDRIEREGQSLTWSWRRDFTNDLEVVNAAAVASESEGGEMAIAICAPATRGPVVRPVATIEILWRLPHWLLSRSQGNATSPGGGLPKDSVLAYPGKSTSGDYARQRLGSAIDETSVLDLDEYLTGQAGDKYAFSFTPLFALHEFNVGSLEELNGSGYQVTAIQWFACQPSGGVDATDHAVRNALFEAWREEVKRVLLLLMRTHGRLDELERLILDGRDLSVGEDVQMLAPGYLRDQENHVVPRRIARLLREYVRRNCYFPYQFIDSTVGHHVAMLAERNVRRMLDEAAFGQAVRGDFQRFMGFGISWEDLSFAERQASNRTVNTRSGSSPGPLWHHLKRLKDKTTADDLSEYWVDLPKGGVTLDLLYGEWRDRAGGDGEEGRVKCAAKQPCVRTDGVPPCFICEFCGFVKVLAWHAANDLAKCLQTRRYTDPAVGMVLEQRDRGTVVTYRNVRRFVAIFGGEMREADGGGGTGTAALCRFAVAEDGDTNDALVHDVLVAVLWNGPLTGGSGTGNSRRQLARWAMQERERGCNVRAWLYEAGATPELFSEALDTNRLTCEDCNRKRDHLWKRVTAQ